eukprot:scaffold244559_cov37-Tisochrysis_lutea.AAC.1
MAPSNRRRSRSLSGLSARVASSWVTVSCCECTGESHVLVRYNSATLAFHLRGFSWAKNSFECSSSRRSCRYSGRFLSGIFPLSSASARILSLTALSSNSDWIVGLFASRRRLLPQECGYVVFCGGPYDFYVFPLADHPAGGLQ